MSVLEKLNSMQKKAAEKIEGPVLILAGAGSGKTRTVTYRIAHMVNERDINPHSILAVTFTNKAAKEMRERVCSLVGEGGESIQVSTFHSFGIKMLRMYGSVIGYNSNFNIYDGDDQKSVVNSIIKPMDLGGDMYKPAKIVSKISRLKEDGMKPIDYEKMAFSDYDKIILSVYKSYQRILRENNALDFADILVYTDELLKDENVIEKIQNRYKYIMVDEYQDTNHIQYGIVAKIAKKNRNICVVGDEDQSIYAFRGADIKNILNFSKDYPEAFVVKLEQNYRSTSTILKAANEVVKNNSSSTGKKLWTENSEGELINLYDAEDGNDEALYIATKIKEVVKNGGKYKDIAILYRNNAQSRVIEEKFIQTRVPYKIFGGMQFYQRKEIKDIFSYFNIINNPLDSLSLKRAINAPTRGVGSRTIEKLDEYRKERGLSFLEVMKEIETIPKISTKIKMALTNLYEIIVELQEMAEMESMSTIVDKLYSKIGYLEKLRENGELGRVDNLEELRSSIHEFVETEEELTISEYLEKISLNSATDELNENDDYVKMMTIHNSKGLEFPIVFLPGWEDELFPGNMDMDSDEEARRLAYVAITRAEKKLIILFANNRFLYGKASYNRAPSRFIDEIPRELINRGRNSYLNDTRKVESRMDSFNSVTSMKKKIDDLKKKREDECEYKIGEYLMHSKFGEGRVKNIVDDKLLIFFSSAGEKKFKINMVEKFFKRV